MEISADCRCARARETFGRFEDVVVLLAREDRKLLERGDHQVNETQEVPTEELEHDRIRHLAQGFLVDGVQADALARRAIVELRLDVDRLDELELEEPRNEQLRHLDPGVKALESVHDALQVPGRLSDCGEEVLALLDADARMIEVDRKIRSLRIEGEALQADRTV